MSKLTAEVIDELREKINWQSAVIIFLVGIIFISVGSTIFTAFLSGKKPSWENKELNIVRYENNLYKLVPVEKIYREGK